MANGVQVSWMNIADEATSTALQTEVFSPKYVTELSEKEVALAINCCFVAEGLPRRIKIDNGLPLARPQMVDVPTLTELWWIGLGIEVVRNAKGCPEQNGTVEGLQGIVERWSEPQCSNDTEEFQKAVDEAIRNQRYVYRMPRKKNQIRAKLYPSLATNPRRYNPLDFSMARVYEFLSKRVWKRSVCSTGSIGFCKTTFYIGRPYKNQEVFITFNPIDKNWIVRKRDGTQIKIESKIVFDENEILKHVDQPTR